MINFAILVALLMPNASRVSVSAQEALNIAARLTLAPQGIIVRILEMDLEAAVISALVGRSLMSHCYRLFLAVKKLLVANHRARLA